MVGQQQQGDKVKKGGLGKWFGEKWIDIKTGKACGRSNKEKTTRDYPACRPVVGAKKMTSAQKKEMIAKKNSPVRKNWPVNPQGKKK